jgi:hypothetical protein
MKIARCNDCGRRLPGELAHGPCCRCPKSEKVIAMWEKLGEMLLNVPRNKENDMSGSEAAEVFMDVMANRKEE